MTQHFCAANLLVEQGVLTEEENEMISEHVADYYASQMRPAD